MKTIAVLATAVTFAFAHEYHHHEDWLKTPEGLEHIGNSHGEIDVDSEGNFYVSIVGGPKAGIQVYSPDGKYLRNLPNARNNHHGFTIVQEDGKDIIYAACLGDSKTALLKLDLKRSSLKSLFRPFPRKWAQVCSHSRRLRSHGLIIDGYRSDRIFMFDKKGIYKGVTAGKAAPYEFRTAHKFGFDRRYNPVRVLVCDRSRTVSFTLISRANSSGSSPPAWLVPAMSTSMAITSVAQLASGVSIFDKEGKLVKRLGASDNPKEFNTNNVAPAKWRKGITTSPHGATFDKDGNVVTTEWNKWGRILRWNVKDKK